jgi:hypothetical protein
VGIQWDIWTNKIQGIWWILDEFSCCNLVNPIPKVPKASNCRWFLKLMSGDIVDMWGFLILSLPHVLIDTLWYGRPRGIPWLACRMPIPMALKMQFSRFASDWFVFWDATYIAGPWIIQLVSNSVIDMIRPDKNTRKQQTSFNPGTNFFWFAHPVAHLYQ